MGSDPQATSALPTKRERWQRLKPEVAAHLLGCSVKTLERWRKQGKGPAWLKYGRHVRYEPSEIRRYIAAQGTSVRAR